MSAAVSQSQPRILFLDHVGVLGGAELNLVDMVRHTRSRNHVILMANGPLRSAIEAVGAGVTVLAVPAEISTVRRGSGLLRLIKTVPHVLSLAWKIAKHARDFDLVWANSQKSFVIGCFAAAIARRPLVWHMHDILTAGSLQPRQPQDRRHPRQRVRPPRGDGFQCRAAKLRRRRRSAGDRDGGLQRNRRRHVRRRGYHQCPGRNRTRVSSVRKPPHFAAVRSRARGKHP